MKLTKTKLFLIFLVLIAITLSVFFILKPKEKAALPPPPRNLAPFNPPQLEADFISTAQIKSQLREDKIVIPSQLPAYLVSGEIWSETEILSIASKLGFSSEPVKLKDGRDGDVFVWSGPGGDTLRIVPSLSKIDYKSPARAETIDISRPFPPDDDLILIARDFLIQRVPLSLPTLKFSRLIFLTLGNDTFGVAEKEVAEFADVQFTETVESYPILNTRAPGTIDIKINRAGRITSVFIDQTRTLSPQTEYLLKTFEELEASLPQATIQSLNQGTINILNDPTVKVASIVVETAHLAYLQEQSPTRQILQPIFVLAGTATLTDMKIVPVILYLPAFKYSKISPAPIVVPNI